MLPCKVRKKEMVNGLLRGSKVGRNVKIEAVKTSNEMSH
jgi:hypothetical protein